MQHCSNFPLVYKHCDEEEQRFTVHIEFTFTLLYDIIGVPHPVVSEGLSVQDFRNKSEWQICFMHSGIAHNKYLYIMPSLCSLIIHAHNLLHFKQYNII